MKKFILPILGFAMAIFAFNYLGATDVSAQIADGGSSFIRNTDRPDAVGEATGDAFSFRAIAETVLNFFLAFLGFIAVIMVIYGGFLYLTSAGNDANVEKGKNILIYAAIGIIVILISYALVNTLFNAGSKKLDTVATLAPIVFQA